MPFYMLDYLLIYFKFAMEFEVVYDVVSVLLNNKRKKLK
jgi:hypothetical protein